MQFQYSMFNNSKFQQCSSDNQNHSVTTGTSKFYYKNLQEKIQKFHKEETQLEEQKKIYQPEIKQRKNNTEDSTHDWFFCLDSRLQFQIHYDRSRFMMTVSSVHNLKNNRIFCPQLDSRDKSTLQLYQKAKVWYCTKQAKPKDNCYHNRFNFGLKVLRYKKKHNCNVQTDTQRNLDRVLQTVITQILQKTLGFTQPSTERLSVPLTAAWQTWNRLRWTIVSRTSGTHPGVADDENHSAVPVTTWSLADHQHRACGDCCINNSSRSNLRLNWQSRST